MFLQSHNSLALKREKKELDIWIDNRGKKQLVQLRMKERMKQREKEIRE
jgi:hypothetical protein